MKTLRLKNRLTRDIVYQRNGHPFEIAPGEEVEYPEAHARFAIKKSLLKEDFEAGTRSFGFGVIGGAGWPEPDESQRLDRLKRIYPAISLDEDKSNPVELFDRENEPPQYDGEGQLLKPGLVEVAANKKFKKK